MAIDFGRKALSKLSGFLSSAKISRCASPPPTPHQQQQQQQHGHRDAEHTTGLGAPRGTPAAGPGLGVATAATAAAAAAVGGDSFAGGGGGGGGGASSLGRGRAKAKGATGGMEAEFDEIEHSGDWSRLFALLRARAEPGPGGTQARFQAARRPDNRKLNRYTDVLPFDHSRVVLGRGDVDYINANQVVYERARRSYILTQGPLEETVGHFWLMAWEQRVPVIIMLNKVVEKQRLKCHKYWPDAGDPLTISQLQLSVELVSEAVTDSYVRRTLRLTDTKSGDSREVVQFQYTEWPDFGIPQCPDEFLQFLELVRGSGLLSGGQDDEHKGPPVIHCSAGIGRSGTFCLVDIVLKMLEDGTVKDDGDIDLQGILLDLRKSRIGLIQTPDQLKFAYIVLIEAVKRKRDASALNSHEDAGGLNASGAEKDAKEPMDTEFIDDDGEDDDVDDDDNNSSTGCNGNSIGDGQKAKKKKTKREEHAIEEEEHVDDDEDNEKRDGADADEDDDDDDEVASVVLRSGSMKSAKTQTVSGGATETVDRGTTIEKSCRSSSSSSSSSSRGRGVGIGGTSGSRSSSVHMHTNGPELDAETTQEGAGEQRDEELQTEVEKRDRSGDGSVEAANTSTTPSATAAGPQRTGSSGGGAEGGGCREAGSGGGDDNDNDNDEEDDDGDDDDDDDDESSSPQKRAHHRLSLNNSDSKEEPILKRTKSQGE